MIDRGPASVGAEAHAFVTDLERPVLDADDRHHWERVLRLRPGAHVTLGDGAGAWRPARFGATLEPDGEVAHDPAPVPPVGVAFSLVKGDRPELIVQKLTELGVDLVVPMHADRCVVRWDGDRAQRHVARLRKVAREAAMQCRRSWLPEVTDVRAFAEVAALPGVGQARGGGAAPSLATRLVMVGPEGGWSGRELDAALPGVALGPLVLRAETAAVAAGALPVALRSGLVRPAHAE